MKQKKTAPFNIIKHVASRHYMSKKSIPVLCEKWSGYWKLRAVQPNLVYHKFLPTLLNALLYSMIKRSPRTQYLVHCVHKWQKEYNAESSGDIINALAKSDMRQTVCLEATSTKNSALHHSVFDHKAMHKFVQHRTSVSQTVSVCTKNNF